jgi:hypothetical protein
MRLQLGVKRAAADSDSGRSPSDDEKAIGRDKISGIDELPPDPDEHLTPEEKAEIVSRSHLFSLRLSHIQYI